MPDQYVSFVVRLAVPPGATAADIESYVREAVRCWHGRKSPGDPLYGLERRKVTVKRCSPSRVVT